MYSPNYTITNKILKYMGIIEAAKEYATLQEMCDVFRSVFGQYRDPGIY